MVLSLRAVPLKKRTRLSLMRSISRRNRRRITSSLSLRIYVLPMMVTMPLKGLPSFLARRTRKRKLTSRSRR